MANEVSIIVSAKDLATGVLKQVGRTMEAESRKWDQAAKSVEKYNTTMRRTALAVVAATALIGAASVKMAMNAVESENLFTVSMGKMSDSARKWSESLRSSLGLNAYEVRKNVGVLDVMLKSMGLGEKNALAMSEGFTQLAYDMASFYNLNPEEAFEKIRSGIVGEIKPLKDIGISVDEASVKTYAYTHGIAKQGQELSATGKVMARYGVIMEATKLAQGDLARTIDSPTNKLRVFQERIKNLAIDLGMALIPAFTSALDAVDPLVKSLEKMSQNGELQAWASKASDAVKQLVEKIAQIGKWVAENGETVRTWVVRFLAAWAVTEAIAGIAKFITSINTLRATCLLLATDPVFLAIGAIALLGGFTIKIAKDAKANNLKGFTEPAPKAGAAGLSGSGMSVAGVAQWKAMQDAAQKASREMYGPPGPPTSYSSPSGDKSYVTTGTTKAKATKAASVHLVSPAMEMMGQRYAEGYRQYMEKKANDELAFSSGLQNSSQRRGSLGDLGFDGSITAVEESMKAAETYHQSVIEGYQKMGNDWRKSQVAQRKAKEEQDKALAEELARKKAAAQGTLTGMLTGKLSVVGGVKEGMNASSALGMGGGIGMLIGLITQSKTFEKILAIINPILQMVADTAGRLLEPLMPLVQTIGDILAPVLAGLGQILSAILMPLMPPLFIALKGLGLIVLGLSWAIGKVVNAIIEAAQGVWRGIASLLRNIGLGGLADTFNGAADAAEQYKVNTDAMADAMGNLIHATLGEQKAKAELTATTNAANEAMRNVPEIFKVALARNTAAKGIPAFATGGYVPASPGGSIVRVGEGGEGEYIVPKSKMGGVTINVNVNGGTNPTETKRLAKEGVFEALRQFGMAKNGLWVGV